MFRKSRIAALLSPFIKKQLRLLPVLDSIRSYDRIALNHDGLAAFIVALLALPQGLALALIAGLPAAHGVFASIAGLALGSIFTGARHVSFGPSVTTAVLVMSTFVRLNVSPQERAEVLIVLLILSGLILCLGAILRFALLARYISRSVTTGFIVAAGILILTSQMKHVLGLPLPDTGIFATDLRWIVLSLMDIQWQSLLTGTITAGAYLAISRQSPAWPAAAIAVVAGSVAAWFLEFGGFPVVHLDDFHPFLIPHADTVI